MLIPVRSRTLALVVGAGLLTTLSACGGGASKDDPTAVASAISSLSASGAPTSAAPAPAGENCSTATDEIRAGVGVSGSVTSVQLFGDCTTAEVATSLGGSADDVDAALAICGIAVAQGAPQGVTTVNVSSVDGTGLAIGLAGGDCIRVPTG